MAASADDHLRDDELAAVALGDHVERGAAAQLATHLDGCAPCRRELAVLDRVIKVTRTVNPALDGLGPDYDRLEKLWSQVSFATGPMATDRPDTPPAGSGHRTAWLRRAVVAAVIVLALGVGALAGRLGSRNGSGPARSDGKPVGRAVLTARQGTPQSARVTP